MGTDLTCRKRNGAVVPFDEKKIRRALFLCFNSIGLASRLPGGSGEEEALVGKLTAGVVNTLQAQKKYDPSVEDVQRLVLQQLWARGLFDAAEHYQNYREERRRLRLRSPIDADTQARFDEMKGHFPTDLQTYQFLSKFSRWDDARGRRETWRETVYDRVIPWLFSLPGVTLTADEKRELADAMYAQESSPAMRVVQMAGPALDRCMVGVFNCAYLPIQDIFSFSELLYILMQGTGVGFSVESDYVSQLPRVRKQNGKTETLVCGDSTEEWCRTFDRHLQLLWDGWDTYVDVSRVRPKGARLKTKGGRASGPDPFLELIAFSRSLLKSRQGRYLEDIDAHDLACKVGVIVQVGGVRRAAEISLSDLDSRAMREAKSGNWYAAHTHRTMANNSAVYSFEGGVPVELFMEEWLSLVKSHSGERGIFNRQAAIKNSPPRRNWVGHRPGCNPCAEILLRPFEFCNLSMAIARPDETRESLRRKVRHATYFGKIQSMATKFGYIRDEWRKNCVEDRLLGVDITGHADCPLLRYGAPGRAELLRELRREVDAVDLMLSARWGVNRSAANTTVKPGGDSAVFFNCASGVSPWFADYSVRWVREPKDTPVAKFLRDSGVPCADAPERPGELAVFGFPRRAPDGATRRNDMTAVRQLENWLEWKTNWAEHSVSATIYVEEWEWPEVGAWVYRHIDQITGLSFLPKDNGVYVYAPNEEISQEKYEEMVAAFPDVNWAKLTEYEKDDETTSRQTFACVGDKC